MCQAALAAAAAWLGAAAPAFGAELDGSFGAEGRGFFERGVTSSRRAVGSLIAEPELVLRSASENELVIVHPFYRWESEDGKRTHFDLRELALEVQRGPLDLRLGVRKVFWGVAESQHVVDILNQTDLVESLDLEQKLGQPMASLNWRPAAFSVELHLLPYFREREFKEAGTRLAPGLPVRGAEYESAERREHLDFAARVQLAPLEGLEAALGYFHGTNREPRLRAAQRGAAAVLVPYYSIIEQTSLELEWIAGSLALKSELFYRAEAGEDTLRAVYGSEYTLFQLWGSRRDLGLIVEHNYDSQRAAALTTLQNDLFAGTRLSFNDEDGSELIAGVFYDLDFHSLVGKLEWSRRLSGALSATLNIYSFHGVKRQEPFYQSRDDGLLELGVRYHF